MATIGDDVFFATIPELNKLIVSKQISAEELTRAFANRLQELGPRFNALALPLAKQAVAAAKDADKEIGRGRLRGPLQGIPYGAKDLLSLAGLPTTWGARPCAKQVFNYTATVITKLSGAGAILAGKLAMVELAGGGGYRYPSASLTGPCLNPWDRARWAGGSSSGSAAAVAAGLLPFAIGSETSGSILTPAAYCGVTALRPTYGLVSRYGAMALSWTLDKLGPFGRSAEDCGLILQAIAGGDKKDPGSAGKSFYYTPQYSKPLKQMTIGFAPADISGRAQESARPAFQAALKVLEDAGADLVEVRLPAFPYGETLSTILSAEQASIFEQLISSGQVDQLDDEAQIAGLKASLDISAISYLKAMRLRRLIQKAIAGLFAEVDAIVAPARTAGATRVGEPLSQPPGARPEARPATNPPPAGLGALIPAGNLAGLPALVFPCGFAENLPVALQVVGAPFSENRLLAVGREFQQRTDWHRRRPGM